jgi:hypothetical protein
MAEMKFNCPKCSQLISCDELWCGQQIQCPTCQTPIAVPAQGGAAAGPKSLVPEVPKETRLSIGQARHAPSSAPPQASANSTLARSAQQFVQPKKKGGGVVKAIIFVVVFAVCAVGGYFGFQKVKEWQDNKNEKEKQAGSGSGGGEFGHAKNLYDVLDATDPSKMGRLPPPRRGGGSVPPPSAAMPMPNAAAPAAAAPTAVVAPIYTLETNNIKIPDSRVNGMVAGTNFVADNVRLDPNPTLGVLVLRFYQGSMMSPDRDILVYLRPKVGEKLAGHNWIITPDMKAAPTVYKRWKPLPTAMQPTAKAFNTGYVMDLELGQIAAGHLSGKIYLALPDTEQTVIAGSFQAETKLPDSSPTAAASTSAVPAPTVARP